MEVSSLTAVDYTATYSSSSSNDSDMETSFKSDEQPQKSLPRNKNKSGPRKLIKLKRKSVVLTDEEIEGRESDEMPRNVAGNVYSSSITSELPSYRPKEKKCLRQRIIVDDDSDEDGE